MGRRQRSLILPLIAVCVLFAGFLWSRERVPGAGTVDAGPAQDDSLVALEPGADEMISVADQDRGIDWIAV